MADAENTDVTVTVTPEPIPADMGPNDIAAFVRDYVSEIKLKPDVMRMHSITPGMLLTLEADPWFKELVEELSKEWRSYTNTAQRLAFQAQAGIEMAMPTIAARMQDEKEPLASVTQTLKQFSEIAGITAKNPQHSLEGEKFVININLGGDKLTYEQTIEATAVSGEVPALPQGATDNEPIQPQPEGVGARLSRQPQPKTRS